MRPLKLTMNGFITYKGKETVDFTKFTQGSLFIISGPTGAGKTTIFDAISFALYGKISSQDRGEGEELRCQYLSPEEGKTYVELLFEVGSKEMRVIRYPRQRIKKPRGKVDLVSEEVELYYEDKVITSKREADEKIVEWTGLTWEQFTKIVLLPQGEFRKFLTAASDEKEEILRKIFDTVRYQKFSEEVRTRHQLLQKKYAGLEQKVNLSVSSLEEDLLKKMGEYRKNDCLPFHFYGEVEHILEEEKKDMLSKAGDLEKEAGVLGERNEKQAVLIHKAKEHNSDIEVFFRRKEELQALVEKEEEFEKYKRRLELAQKATILSIKEGELNRRREGLQKLQEGMEELKRRRTSLEVEHRSVQIEYESLGQMEEEGEKLVRQEEQLKREIEQLDLLEKKQKEEKVLNLKYEEIIKEGQILKQRFIKLEEILQNLSSPLETMQAESRNLMEYKSQSSKREKDVELLREVYRQLKIILGEERACRESEIRLPKLEEQLSLEQEKLTKNTEDFEKQILQVYASSLKEGDPCPLCGSLHHPDIVHIDNSVTKEGLEKQRKKLNEMQALVIEVRENIVQSKKSLLNLKEGLMQQIFRLEKIEELEEGFDEEYELKLLELKKGAEGLHHLEGEETIRNLLTLAKDLGENRKALWELVERKKEASEKKLETLQSQQAEEEKRKRERESLQKRLYEMQTEEALYREKRKNCREEIERRKEVFQAIDSGETEKLKRQEALETLERKKNFLKEKMKEIKTIYQRTADELNRTSGKLNALLETRLEEEKLYREQAKLWEEERNLLFETEDDYRKNLLGETEIRAGMRKVQEYEEAKRDLRVEMETLDQRLESKDRIELPPLEEEKREMEERLELIAALKEELSLKTNQVVQVLSVLKEVMREQERDRSLRENLSVLNRLCSGENASRATLETYVLMYYFEEVLAHANQRLYRMTDGQYSLYRKEDNFKGNRRNRGLELEILDANVGKRRNTTTLSGGEGFLASLSLALGLSDTMMNQVGQIEVHTLFIDEGFGTLDREKLQNAIECLLELTGQHRLIGIISHVEELKQDIPNKILVEYQKDRGSSLKMVY